MASAWIFRDRIVPDAAVGPCLGWRFDSADSGGILTVVCARGVRLSLAKEQEVLAVMRRLNDGLAPCERGLECPLFSSRGVSSGVPPDEREGTSAA